MIEANQQLPIFVTKGMLRKQGCPVFLTGRANFHFVERPLLAAENAGPYTECLERFIKLENGVNAIEAIEVTDCFATHLM